MLEPFAHQALVELADGSDPAALGAAVTIAVCGQLDHEPPCPVAPHFSRTESDGHRVRLRVLFVTEPNREQAVRELSRSGLERGVIRTSAGSAEWVLVDSGPSPVADFELDHAARLAAAN